MAFTTGTSIGPKAEINVTPLIDVLLVLLIIFMVIVPLTPRGLSALLPQVPRGQALAPPEQPILVEVDSAAADRAVYSLNGRPIGKAALASELQRLLRLRQDRTMFVRGDQKLEFSSIAEVIAMGRQASADRIGILTPGMTAK